MSRTLPLRRWLVVMLAITFIVPVAITAIVIAHVLSGPHPPIDIAADELRAGAHQWRDPAWQAAMRAKLAPRHVDFVLMAGRQVIYSSVPDPLTAAGNQVRLARSVTVPGTDQVAHLYADQPTWNQNGPNGDGRPFWLIPIVALIAFTITLAGLGWFLGRMVVRPLAATSRAAHEIAGGNLDITLPDSRVREVAEVNHAFIGMSDALRESLQQQARVEQERRLFIGAVVHDLRTPLFALRGYLDGLEGGVANTPERRAHYLDVARSKAGALEHLIADLFDFTRLEYLDQTPATEPLDLRSLLRQIVDGRQPAADERHITLTLDEPEDAVMVDADQHMLARVIENLLENALRYTPAGGTIRFRVSNDHSHVTFQVEDSGPGISAEDMPHIFAPLFRGETSRNRRTGGAGLGLTVARRILRAHGGDLTAANKPDGGAVFTASLPALSIARRPAPTERSLV